MWCGQRRVEWIEPFAFEINRVRQNQICVERINHAVRDASDTPVRLVACPLVDFRLRHRHVAKVQRLDGGREKILVRFKKIRLDVRALPIPQDVYKRQIRKRPI